jgi:hypothetical protein
MMMYGAELYGRLAAETGGSCAFNTPQFQALFLDLGADPGRDTPGEFRTFMLAHMEKMRKAVVAPGARPE